MLVGLGARQLAIDVGCLDDLELGSLSPMPVDGRRTDVISTARRLTWTRDPFDRLIVATAAVHRAPLITRDERIRAHFADAVW